MLHDKGVISREPCKDDRRSAEYSLTSKGKELEPVLVEMVLWVAKNEMPDLPSDAVDNLRQTRIFDQNCKRRS